MADEALELLQGTLDVLILRTLAGEPMHGYGIAQWIRNRTDGTLAVQDAALYQALRRLEGKGWISAEWGVTENNRRARYYALTAAGRRHLAAERESWERLSRAVNLVLAMED